MASMVTFYSAIPVGVFLPMFMFQVRFLSFFQIFSKCLGWKRSGRLLTYKDVTGYEI